MVIYLALFLVILGFILLIHHGWHHADDPPDSNAKRESCPEVCYFQIPDISNHETWIVACFTNALSLGIIGPLLDTRHCPI